MAIATHQGCPFHDPARLFEDLSELRKKQKLEHSKVLDAYVVSRYEDVIHVLDHPELFSSKVTVPDPPPFLLEMFKDKVPTRGTLLGWDNPDHDRLRLCVSSFFVPRRLARFEPVIRRLAMELIDGFVMEKQADLKEQFALPLPLKVVCTITGLDVNCWEWVGRSLALFGGHAAFSAGTFEEKLQGIMEIHGYIAELIQERKHDRRDDMISHIWNERDSGRVQMTDFEHLSMIPGLMLAGHETTTNLLSMGMAHVLSQDLWEEASRSIESIAATIEELLRFESAITGMKREVLNDTTIGSTELKKGDVVFVAYNSGSRDPSRFVNADKIVIGRKGATQHLGFGRGIHACLGAPLARILLRTEMAVLKERLVGLRLVPGFEKQYDRVHEGRGIDKLLVQWDLDVAKVEGDAGGANELLNVLGPAPVSGVKSSDERSMAAVVFRADGTEGAEVGRNDAHEDLVLPSANVIALPEAVKFSDNLRSERQPSLGILSRPKTSTVKRVETARHVMYPDKAVSTEDTSAASISPAGTSKDHDERKPVSVEVVVQEESIVADGIMHITLVAAATQPLPPWTAGANIHIPVGKFGTRQYSLCSAPQVSELWEIAVLREADGRGGSEFVHSLESGSKMTVVLPRNRFCLRPATEYTFVAGGIGITPIRSMVYAARSAGLPYKVVYLGSSRSRMAFVEEMSADRNVTVWPKDQRGSFDLGRLTCSGLIYACGPVRLLGALQEFHPNAVVEHFNALEQGPNEEFDVVLRSGRVLRVPKERSVLEVLVESGVSVMSTCGVGTCGTCEVGVVSGEVEHRDTVLTPEERAVGGSMMVCVSRCRSAQLALDLW
jgi:cytochrome P450/ferredoxin-NADP reductase